MLILKAIILLIIFSVSSFVGINLSKKYSSRVKELKEIKSALNMFEEKIKFTYETIPDVFFEISQNTSESISKIFEEASYNMKMMSAGLAWEKAIDESNTKLTKEDKETLKGLAKMLGKTDLDGQVSEIRLVQKFLDTKLQDAELEKTKNEKLYKTLGVTCGLAIVIVLI